MNSTYWPNVDPTYLFERTGTPDNPFLPIREFIRASDSYVRLKERPSFVKKVMVKDALGNKMNETTSTTPQNNEYRVDYTIGVVYFSPANNEKIFEFSYEGTGMLDMAASRIQFNDGKNLQQLVNTIDTIATNWKPSVNRFSDIATSIPSPIQGDTVQVRDTGKVYRYENGEWINNLDISDTAITDLQSRIEKLESHIDAGSFTDEVDDGSIDGGVF